MTIPVTYLYHATVSPRVTCHALGRSIKIGVVHIIINIFYGAIAFAENNSTHTRKKKNALVAMARVLLLCFIHGFKVDIYTINS